MERDGLRKTLWRIPTVKKLLLLLLLCPVLALAQPPPIATNPLSVNGTTHVVYPTDQTSGMLTNAMSALTMKPWCRVASTSNVATLSGTATPIDSIALVIDDFVLLVAQTTATENGPWLVNSGAWTRPTWYASGHTAQAFYNIAIQVRIGTVNSGTWWRITTTGPITIDTTPTAWAQTSLIAAAAIASNAITTAKILDANVTTTKILDANVTLPKLANIGPMTVLGRTATSGTGAVTATSNPVISSLTIGGGTTVPSPLMAIVPVSGAISFTAKISDESSYAQFALKNSSDSQRGFIGYIGSTFSNPLRRDHFEFGTAAGVPIAFRPGDGDGAGFIMDGNSNLRIANVAIQSASKIIAFPATSQPAAIPSGSPSCGQLYMSATGQLSFLTPTGTPYAITP